ncbi:M3 family oligoendopeptidase [Candidatus Fermentibacteria bacterium]|nr:M3 family oligoendopeptidase [Candidatus Fermentibacteria bacterium]
MFDRLAKRWDLESVYEGGSGSERLISDLQRAVKMADACMDRAARLEVPRGPDDLEDIRRTVLELGDAMMLTAQLGSFAGCLTAQDDSDERAKERSEQVSSVWARLGNAVEALGSIMAEMDRKTWASFLESADMEEIAFRLDEFRRRSRDRMDVELETLANDLATDGYHGWSRMYDAIVGKTRVEYEEDGRTRSLSVGQAYNMMRHPDREVRTAVFDAWEKAWEERRDLHAQVLNHLAGFRIKLYERRGWTSILHETLDDNRVDADTLDVMWRVVESNTGPLLRFLARKSELLGLDGLSWHDVPAPLPGEERELSFEQAASFVVEHLGRFDPVMAEFAERAFRNRWIEAEDRKGKKPGAFCTSLPVLGESRVFMTFDGRMSSVATLAHELGHAYHGWVLSEKPYLARRYSMSVAETASTFSENLVVDAALSQAGRKADRVSLLQDKLQRAAAFFFDLHSRFLFETRFYETRRRRSFVPAQELGEMMREAQREAFGDSLERYHPTFWCSKGHFYATGAPFYNWPYTFGYLFSTGIYARARSRGSDFADSYRALLADTGSATAEQLAERHLGTDLTETAFWQEACDEVGRQVEDFLRESAES